MTPPLFWNKLGLVYSPNGNDGWMHSHAQVPTALRMQDRIRVFFAARPQQTLSLPAFLDLDAQDPTRVLSVHPDPLMDVGNPGSFDQHGVMPSCVVEHNGALWMYYSGWCREVDVPYNNTIGLAVSTDGGKHFERMFEGPVVGRSRFDPFNASSPFVMQENGRWHMWYSSGTGFRKVGTKYEPVYLLRYAHSSNGVDWVIHSHDLIPPLTEDEAQTRPTVIHMNDRYHMWFCYRASEDYRNGKGSYRMGYAVSANGVDWERHDSRAGLAPSATGWDDTMVAYPYIIPFGEGRYLMFYNGNNFGAEGFGIAVGAAG